MCPDKRELNVHVCMFNKSRDFCYFRESFQERKARFDWLKNGQINANSKQFYYKQCAKTAVGA